MFYIEGQCPHCTENRGFEVFAVSAYRSQRTSKEMEIAKRQLKHSLPLSDKKIAQFHTAGECLHCGNPIIVGIEVDDRFMIELRDCITQQDRKYTGIQPKVCFIIPDPIPPYSHPSLPLEINSLFIDMQKMLAQNLAPSLTINGCRSVLEASAKELGGEGKRLIDRIEDLKNKSVINGVLFDWATHIRLEGNGAAHEIKGTPEDAKELVEFTKLFLQYTFEFPARIQELRGVSTT